MAYTPIYTSVAQVQAKTALTNSEVDLTNDDIVRATIQDAELEVELITGRKFTDANAATEYLNGPKRDVIGITGNKATSIRVSKYPIQSLTTFITLNVDGTTATTYGTLSAAQVTAGTFSTTDYWLDTAIDPLTGSTVPSGRIILKTDVFQPGVQNIKAVYTYGYPTVPVDIRDLATCLAAMRVWIRFMSGSYNRLDSYSIPQQNVSKGDFYDRAMKAIAQYKEEAERLLNRVGRRADILYFSTGSDR